MAARCWASPWLDTAELKLGQYIHRKRVPDQTRQDRWAGVEEVLDGPNRA